MSRMKSADETLEQEESNVAESSMDESKQETKEGEAGQQEPPSTPKPAVSSQDVSESKLKSYIENSYDYKIEEIVWARVRGFPFWPAKIMKSPLSPNESKSRNKSAKSRSKSGASESSAKEFYVRFYGIGTSFAYVNKSNMKPYEIGSGEAVTKKSKDKKLNVAIEMAEVEKKLELEVGPEQNSTEETNKSLLSIDEELKLMKKTEEEEKEEAEKMAETSLKTPRRRLANKVAPTSENGTSQRKRNSHLAIQVDKLCNSKSKTEVGESAKKLSGKELDEVLQTTKKRYETFKSIADEASTIFKKEKTRKRRRSDSAAAPTSPASPAHPTPSSASHKKKKKKLVEEEKSSADRNWLNSRASSPVSMSLELDEPPKATFDSILLETAESLSNAIQFDSATLVFDSTEPTYSNKWLVLYLLEKLSEYFESRSSRLRVVLFDIARRKDTQGLESFLKEESLSLANLELKFVDEFESAFQSELIISLVTDLKVKSSTEPTNNDQTNSESTHYYEKYEERLLSHNIAGLKYVALAPLSYPDAAFYHYFFDFNGAYFVEAPLLHLVAFSKASYAQEFHNSFIYASAVYNEIFFALRNFFALIVSRKNVIFKDLQFGVPSSFVSQASALFTANRRMISELADALPSLSENNSYLIENEGDEKNYESFLKNLNSKKKDELRSCFQDELKNTFYKTIDSFFPPKPNEESEFLKNKKYSDELNVADRLDSNEQPVDSV